MYYRDFKRSDPPPHYGTIDGIAAEEGIMQLEKIFDAIYVLDNGERVRLATFYFRDVAETW